MSNHDYKLNAIAQTENIFPKHEYALFVEHIRRGKLEYRREVCNVGSEDVLSRATQAVIEYCKDLDIPRMMLNMWAESHITIGLHVIDFAKQDKLTAPKSYWKFILKRKYTDEEKRIGFDEDLPF